MSTVRKFKQRDIRDIADEQLYGNIPFSVMKALHHSGLTASARFVYMHYWMHSRMNPNSYWSVTMTVDQVAADLNLKSNTVRKAHRELIEKGWIKRTEQPRYQGSEFDQPPSITTVLIPGQFARDILESGRKRSTAKPESENTNSDSDEGLGQGASEPSGDQDKAPTPERPLAGSRATPPAMSVEEAMTGDPTNEAITALLASLSKADRSAMRRWLAKSASRAWIPLPESLEADEAVILRIKECAQAGCTELLDPTPDQAVKDPSSLSGVGKAEKVHLLADKADAALARAQVYEAATEAGADPKLMWESVKLTFTDKDSWYRRNATPQNGFNTITGITKSACKKIRKHQWKVQAHLRNGRKPA